MDGLTFSEDIRAIMPHPDADHCQNFREGWNKGARKEHYEDERKALDRLTWENLGYRLGWILGSASEPFIDAMFSMCSLLQHERKSP